MPRLAVVCRRIEGLSGAAKLILENARRLSARGWEVHAYGERLDREALGAAGARAHRLPGWPWGSFLKRRIFAAVSDALVRRGGYDLVHGHGDNLEMDVLSLHNCVHAAHEAVHGEPLPASSGTGRLHERLLRRGSYRALLANSRLMRAELLERFGVPPEKVVVVYPGYDRARFKPSGGEAERAATRRELGCRDGDVLFGLVTSGDFVKRGVARFIEAFSRLAAGNPSVRALVVGKEARLGPYLDLVRKQGLEGRLQFRPPIAAVERLYRALDVYVHPALYEEFGMSVQEAIASGLPVIAGSRVGAAELFEGEMRDYLLSSADPAELSALMGRLAADPEARRRLSAAGPKAARSDWEAHFAATLSVYERLLRPEAGGGKKS